MWNFTPGRSLTVTTGLPPSSVNSHFSASQLTVLRFGPVRSICSKICPKKYWSTPAAERVGSIIVASAANPIFSVPVAGFWAWTTMGIAASDAAATPVIHFIIGRILLNPACACRLAKTRTPALYQVNCDCRQYVCLAITAMLR